MRKFIYEEVRVQLMPIRFDLVKNSCARRTTSRRRDRENDFHNVYISRNTAKREKSVEISDNNTELDVN